IIWTRESASPHGVGFIAELIPLLEMRETGLVVVNGSADDLDESFWTTLEEMRWIDPDRVWLVSAHDEPVDFPAEVRLVDPREESVLEAVLAKIGEGAEERR
ncbi:MAG: hypothetical protein R3338_15270, partial [Thermoanaerobaculia bacterium]|nr:hypothetical protein [Thermoanaerobaculia bacterium]